MPPNLDYWPKLTSLTSFFQDILVLCVPLAAFDTTSLQACTESRALGRLRSLLKAPPKPSKAPQGGFLGRRCLEQLNLKVEELFEGSLSCLRSLRRYLKAPSKPSKVAWLRRKRSYKRKKKEKAEEKKREKEEKSKRRRREEEEKKKRRRREEEEKKKRRRREEEEKKKTRRREEVRRGRKEEGKRKTKEERRRKKKEEE
eukprot:s2642_g13.t1